MPTTFNDTVILSDLVAYYTLDENSGTRTDSTSFHNDLVENTGSVTHAVGILSNSALFSSANNNILKATNAQSLQGGNKDFTIGCWLFFNSFLNNFGIISKASLASIDYEIGTVSVLGTTRLYFNLGGLSANFHSSLALVINTWYFIICSFDSVNNQLSIQINNGTPDSTSINVGSLLPSTDNLYVGGNNYATPLAFNGRIDELFKVDRILLNIEKFDLYNDGLGDRFPDVEVEFGVNSLLVPGNSLGSSNNYSQSTLCTFQPVNNFIVTNIYTISHGGITYVPIIFGNTSNYVVSSIGTFPNTIQYSASNNFSLFVGSLGSRSTSLASTNNCIVSSVPLFNPVNNYNNTNSLSLNTVQTYNLSLTLNNFNGYDTDYSGETFDWMNQTCRIKKYVRVGSF